MSKKVLIVEDERPLAHALQLKLQHEKIDAQIATNGQECLDMIKAQKFDVVLLDMMMPVLGGFAVLEEINKMTDHKPTVFVLSNLSVHDDQDKVLSMGAKKYFIKSDTPLAVIVDEILKA